MARVTVTKQMDAPTEAVFAVMADFEHAADTIRGIKRLEMLTEGPVGVGTRFRETRVFMKREATEDMEVTAFEAGKSYAVECESCGCHFRTDVSVRPDGAGSVVEMDMKTRPLTVAAKLMSPVSSLMMGSMRKYVEKDLDDIKHHVEGGRTAATTE